MKKSGRFLGTFFVTLLATITALCLEACSGRTVPGSGSSPVAAGTPVFSPESAGYLAKNRQSIDLSKGIQSPCLLDSAVKDKKVILCGESHGIAEVADLRVTLLEYLHANAGVRNLLLEAGYGSTRLIQMYLDTGDEKWLKTSFAELDGTFAYNREAYNAWKKVYQWNKSLPETERVRVIGIDVEHQYMTGIAYLAAILPANPPDKVSALSGELSAIASGRITKSRSDLKAFCSLLEKSLLSLRTTWDAYLGTRYWDFSFALKDILTGFAFYDLDQNQSQSADFREYAIFQNFIEVYSHFGEGMYFGQFGQAHTFLEKTERGEVLGHLLNRDSLSPVAGKVLSLAVFYEDCTSVTNAQTWKVQAYSSNRTSVETFGPVAESDVTLFGLLGEESPFQRQGSGTGGTDTVLADYYQYVLLIRNGHPITRLGE